MKTYRLQKRLASEILGVGINRVWLDPENLDEIGKAITKADVEKLIKDGLIKKLPKKGVKRRAGRRRQKKKRRGKGKVKKRVKKRKKLYVRRVRSLRRYLKALKEEGKIDSKEYRKLRTMIKAGLIKTKADIKARIWEKE